MANRATQHHPRGHRWVDPRLAPALAVNSAGCTTPHVVVALPSYSVGESLLHHYGERLQALEHRYLVALLMAHRLSSAELVFVGSVAPAPEVVAHYRCLGPGAETFDARTQLIALEDRSARSVAAKLLGRPDLLERIREVIAGRPAFLEPWNVTEDELRVAERLHIPINGMHPSLRSLGFKSAGRRLFRDAGVPVPRGVENVRSVDDVVAAAVGLAVGQDPPTAVVVKHDDSGAGDGNAVLSLGGDLRDQVEALPAWYLADLTHGAVVEELLTGVEVSSPSAQIDLLPDGTARVIATHEQLLGGPNGQVFLGCRFPADPAYAATLADHATAVGERLAAAGVVGRASLDFLATRDSARTWRTHALEVNLRKGGTTHPFTALRNLVSGHYDTTAGQWVADLDGRARAYVCTDNLVDPAWQGLSEGAVVDAVREAGLCFDHRTGTGVVLHMLAGLGVDGRFGLVAIGHDPAAAEDLARRTERTVRGLRLPG